MQFNIILIIGQISPRKLGCPIIILCKLVIMFRPPEIAARPTRLFAKK